MSLQDALFAIENEFKTNWVDEPIHFGTNPASPKSLSWVQLSVVALDDEAIGYGMCSIESHMLYATCYASNQVKAANLADRVSAFIENKKLGDYLTAKAHPVHQADVNQGTYFYRIGVPFKN